MSKIKKATRQNYSLVHTVVLVAKQQDVADQNHYSFDLKTVTKSKTSIVEW